MDKLLQDDKELQDEELYALLDKALESDRLCVSEELIQKTLRRVEAESASGVVSLEQKRKRKYPFMRYACVAAAAMLVLAVGVRTFSGKKFAAEDARKEATADGMYSNSGANGFMQDSAVYPSEQSESDAVAWRDDTDDGAGRGDYQYSKSERDGHPNAATDLSEEECTPLTGSTENVSERVVTALTELGFAITDSEADYWEFVQREDFWETELLRRLVACDFDKGYAQEGSYSYELVDKAGRMYTVNCEEPLDAVAGFSTENGRLWILFGRNVSLFEE